MKESILFYSKETGVSIDTAESRSYNLNKYGVWLEELNEQRIREEKKFNEFVKEVQKITYVKDKHIPLLKGIEEKNRTHFLHFLKREKNPFILSLLGYLSYFQY